MCKAAAALAWRARCAPPPPRALHPDEQKRRLAVLAKATGEEAIRDWMLVELLLGTGIRIGSAPTLDVDDLDFAHGEIRLRTTKNDRPTTAVLPAGVAERLKAFVSERAEGAVFLAGDQRISMRHAQRRLSNWFAAAQRGAVGALPQALVRMHPTQQDRRSAAGSSRDEPCEHRQHDDYTTVDRATLRAAMGS